MSHPHEKEKDFQRAIIQLAEAKGWRAYHVANVRGNLRNGTAVGFPDLCLAHPRYGVIFAEVKGTKGKMTDEQWQWRDVLLESKQHWHLWRPADWDTICALLGGVKV